MYRFKEIIAGELSPRKCRQKTKKYRRPQMVYCNRRNSPLSPQLWGLLRWSWAHDRRTWWRVILPVPLRVGRYCLHYLAGVSLNADHVICGEYFCGEFSAPKQEETAIQTINGTSATHFVPEYSPAVQTEFCQTIQEALRRDINLQVAVQKTRKWHEVEQYIGATSTLMQLITEFDLPPPTRQKLLTAVRANDIPKPRQ